MIRLKQFLIITLGVVLAGGMVLLGVWQLDVYHEQGARASARRAAEPPITLTVAAPAGAAVVDGYGRSVTFDGVYDPALQLLVPVDGAPGHYRVLTALKQADGSVVPVVRGVVTSVAAAPPPTGTVHQTGVLLPSEETSASTTTDPKQISSVRVPALAQQWPGPLVGGFVTLDAADADAQGLAPAFLALPESSGRLRNGAYAVQWWLFAAFAVAMAVRMARDFGRQEFADVPEITAGSAPDPT
ncbi:MAG TPA: SURF1 family cytochrome oxidase biogenesis protein [Propionibacteriaceae bacterium]